MLIPQEMARKVRLIPERTEFALIARSSVLNILKANHFLFDVGLRTVKSEKQLTDGRTKTLFRGAAFFQRNDNGKKCRRTHQVQQTLRADVQSICVPRSERTFVHFNDRKLFGKTERLSVLACAKDRGHSLGRLTTPRFSGCGDARSVIIKVAQPQSGATAWSGGIVRRRTRHH